MVEFTKLYIVFSSMCWLVHATLAVASFGAAAPPPDSRPPMPQPLPPLGFQPNILLLFPDEWRFDWDGFRADDGPVPLAVPNLRAFAAKGTRFQHAYVPAPVCAPSRASLASGREFDLAHLPTNVNDTGCLPQPACWHALLARADPPPHPTPTHTHTHPHPHPHPHLT